MQSKISLILLIACSFNVVLAQMEMDQDILGWSWISCREHVQQYSQFRDLNQNRTMNDTYVFNCAKESQKSSCEIQRNLNNLTYESQKFYNVCLSKYSAANAITDVIGTLFRGSCSAEQKKCDVCRSAYGKSIGCKTLENENTLLQNEYNKFKNSTRYACGIDLKCRNDLTSFAKQSCSTSETKSCLNEWVMDNIKDDPCVDYLSCRLSSSIISLSAFILIAFFAF